MPSPEYETIDVPVQFIGTVRVKVRKTVPVGRRRPLATKIAICYVFATADNNPDAPEEDAVDEYAFEHELGADVARDEWDVAGIDAVSGVWKPRPA